MTGEPRDRSDLLVALVFILMGAAVLLPNLGDRALWVDEAETALVAQGILRTGLPVAWDGRILASQSAGSELSDSLLWGWTPWAMHYVAAAGMAVSGQTALGARLPFALLGCLSFGMTYLLARRLIRDRWASCAAALLLLSSVQYLLLMRQCRYYAIVPVVALALIWAYTELPRRRGTITVTVCLAVLFHTNYAIAALIWLGLAGHALLFRRDRAISTRLLGASVVAALIILPWVLGVGLHERLGAKSGRTAFGPGVLESALMINQFISPWLVLAGLGVAGFARKLRFRGAYAYLICMLVPPLILLPLFLWANPRYVPHLFPLGAIVLAAAWREVDQWNRPAGVLLAAVLGLTNLLPALFAAGLPASISSDYLGGHFATGSGVLARAVVKREWVDYVHELREPFVGTDEAISRFLQKHAKPDEFIMARPESLPVIFHTRLRQAGLLRPASRKRPGWKQLPEYLWDRDAADWLVLRANQGSAKNRHALSRRFARRAALQGRRIVTHRLPVADVSHANRPYLDGREDFPNRHFFRMPEPSRPDEVVLLHMLRRGDRADRAPRSAQSQGTSSPATHDP